MTKYTALLIVCFSILLYTCLQALDPPHDSSNGIGCGHCHATHKSGMAGSLIPSGAQLEAQCKSCHNPTGQASARCNVGNHLVHNGATIIDCGSCHDPHGPVMTTDPHTGTEALNLKLIRDKAKGIPGALDIVVYQESPDHFAFDESCAPWNGVCQTCHTETDYHRNNGSCAHTHQAGASCTLCHPHENNFMPTGGGVCDACHNSHATHLERSNGPHITDCFECHASFSGNHPNGIGRFASGIDTSGDGNIDLSETDVCDACHSPDGPFDGVAEGKSKWSTDTPLTCRGCHDTGSSIIQGVSSPPVAGDNVTWGYFLNGHGRNNTMECTECHDKNAPHIDGEPRTYSFDSAFYSPTQSGVAYAAGYRLKYINSQVPLMIPANYSITFQYNSQTMKDNAFRLCFNCHDAGKILDDTPGNGIDSNFKASLPRPPRNYSYAWGSGADTNEHVSHLMNYVGPFADSDWDTGTNGPGGSDGRDTTMACTSCHNVHGVQGIYGSTNEVMIRDGTLAQRTGYGFSYVIDDGYPYVTSSGATQSNSVGAIFRNNTANMCGGQMCHGNPAPPTGSRYNAQGSSWGTYLEYYRPWLDH